MQAVLGAVSLGLAAWNVWQHKAIRRCLDEVQQFGLWARNRNYQKLAAV